MSEIKKIPERTCVVCRTHIEKEKLMRVVKTKDGVFSIDLSGKKEGRGIYICKTEGCITKAIKSRVFSKVFKMETPNELYEGLKKTLDNKN